MSKVEEDVHMTNKILQNRVETLEKQVFHFQREREKLLMTLNNNNSEHDKQLNLLKSSLTRYERQYHELKDLCDEKDRNLQAALVHAAVKTDEAIFNKSISNSRKNRQSESPSSLVKEHTSKYGVKEVMRQKAINDSLRQEIHKLVTAKTQDIFNLKSKIDELTLRVHTSDSHKNDLKDEINRMKLRNAELESENLKLYNNIRIKTYYIIFKFI